MRIIRRLLWGDPVLVIPLEDVPEGVIRSQGAGWGPADRAKRTPEEAADYIMRNHQDVGIGYHKGPKTIAIPPAGGGYVVAVWEKDVAAPKLNYGTSGKPSEPGKPIKQWPHDCPRCGGRECAIQLFTTWDCRNGCWS